MPSFLSGLVAIESKARPRFAGHETIMDTMRFEVSHLSGSLEGKTSEFDLADGATVLIGREPHCDLAFDPYVDLATSGHHAKITRRGEELFIEDLNSSNGTFVDEEVILEPCAIGRGAVLMFGRGGPRSRVTTGPERAGSDGTRRSPQTEVIAGTAQPRGVGANTVALMINQATAQTSRRFLYIIGGLTLLLLACVGVVVVLAVTTKEASRAQEEELGKTKDELAKAQVDLSQSRSQMETALAEERIRMSANNLASSLEQERVFREQIEAARTEVSDAMRVEFESKQQELLESLLSVETSLTEKYGHAMYMLTYSPDEKILREVLKEVPPADHEGFDEGFCTAFAITDDGWLATNAHCVDAIFEFRYELGRKGLPTQFYAKRNGDSQTAYPLLWETSTTHPRYTHTASPDVAIIKMDLGAVGKDKADAVVQLAPKEDMASLSVGQPIYTLGFPGKVMNPYRVSADFRGGNIARLTDFDSSDTSAAANQFVWHTALISKGTSGSPMFDRLGRVVAINNGTMSAERVVTSDGTKEKVSFIYSADGLSFGIRADLLWELLEWKGVTVQSQPTPSPVKGLPLDPNL